METLLKKSILSRNRSYF